MNDLTTTANSENNDIAALAPITFDAKAYAAAIFDPFKRQVSKAKREAAKVEAYDITTTAGMSRAKELRASFREIRTGVENVRKDRKAPIIEAGKLLDQRAAEIKAEVEPFEEKYDAEIKAEEARKEAEKQRKLAEERARVEAIENRIAQIRGVPGRLASADSATIGKEIDQWTLLRLDPADYQEHLEDALNAVNTTIDQLTSLREAAEAREAEARRIVAEREELARLRAEQEKREQAERAAAAERERVAKIEQERVDAERRAAAEREAEQQRQLAEAQAQQAKQMAQQSAAMATITRMQSIAAAVESAYSLEKQCWDIAQEKPSEALYGMAAPMVAMAQTMAVNQLQARITAMVAEELPQAWDDAHAENQEYSSDGTVNEYPIVLGGKSIYEDQPPEAEAEPEPDIPAAAPAASAPTDGAQVAALRAAVRALRATRTTNEIADIVAEELEMIESESDHDAS